MKTAEDILNDQTPLALYAKDSWVKNNMLKAMDVWGKQCFEAARKYGRSKYTGKPIRSYDNYEHYLKSLEEEQNELPI